MSSSELDDFQLNLDRLTRAASLLLDQGQLNVNAVAGKLSYNADDATYDDLLVTYDGTITQLVRSSANLNGLSASVASTPVVTVTASSDLGALTSASISAVSHIASSDASLGAMNSTASTISQIFPIFDALLGDLANVATAIVTHIANASGSLGSLNSNADTTPTIKPVFMSSLGLLDATASATVIPPTPPVPPEPEIVGYGSNRPYASPQAKQPEVIQLPEPTPVVINKTQPARPVKVPATIVVSADINATTFSTLVGADVEWSILEDEADLLLML